MFKKAQNKKGFSLIELMIVVAIIGILAAIAIPQLAGFRKRAIRAGMLSDARSVASVYLAYSTDTQSYAALSTTAMTGPGAFDIVAGAVATGTTKYATNLSNGNTLTGGNLSASTFTVNVGNPGGDDVAGITGASQVGFAGPVAITHNGVCTWIASPMPVLNC